jgi:hypothetical protein
VCLTFPSSAVDVFGVRARVPVKAQFDGTVDYTGSLAPYGGQHRLGVRKDIQKSLGKTRGDNVSVCLVLDTGRAQVAGSASRNLKAAGNRCSYPPMRSRCKRGCPCALS